MILILVFRRIILITVIRRIFLFSVAFVCQERLHFVQRFCSYHDPTIRPHSSNVALHVISTITPRTTEFSSESNENSNENHQRERSPSSTSQYIHELIAKFQSYSSNIARTRLIITKGKRMQNVSKKFDESDNHHQSNANSDDNKMNQPFISAVQSLFYTLKNEQGIISQWNDHPGIHSQLNPLIVSSTSYSDFVSAFTSTLIQVIRGLADLNDYIFLQRFLLEGVLPFAKIFTTTFHLMGEIHEHEHAHEHHNIKRIQPAFILHSRIFGEAIAGMGQRTSCNISKLKKLWNSFLTFHEDHLLLTPPTAQELTAMMIGLAQRGKVKAALDLFHHHCLQFLPISFSQEQGQASSSSDHVFIPPDAYSISALFHILAESIPDPSYSLLSSPSVSSPTRQPPTKTAITANHQVTTSTDNTDHFSHHDGYDDVASSSMTLQSLSATTITKATPDSPCWQWRETEDILNRLERFHLEQQAVLQKPKVVNKETWTESNLLNNHVYSAALKVNERAYDFFLFHQSNEKHYGAKFAIRILNGMKKTNILPDVITCSSIISSFDKGYQWKAAVALLNAMEKSAQKKAIDGNRTTDDKNQVWHLPSPNVYTYSTAISSCAKCGRFDEAISILDRMRSMDDTTSNEDTNSDNSWKVAPNTWVYNAVLSAFSSRSIIATRSSGKDELIPSTRIDNVFKLLQRMEMDMQRGFDTAPDTVTYNTAIAVMGGIHMTSDKSDTEDEILANSYSTTLNSQYDPLELITDLMNRMDEKNIERNEVTYRNAILACRFNSDGTVPLLRRALVDTFYSGSLESIMQVKRGLVNAALSICASRGNISAVVEIFNIMKQSRIKADSISMQQLVRVLALSSRVDDSMTLLNAMKGDAVANQIFAERNKVDVIASGILIPMVEELHYSTAITGCLRSGEMFLAQKILTGMKLHGLAPNDFSLHDIIRAYCKMSIDEASKEFEEARKEYRRKNKSFGVIKPIHSASVIRATAAVTMMNTLQQPPLDVRVTVASACAASGLHMNAREILRSLHREALHEQINSETYEPEKYMIGKSVLQELPKLHKSLLKLCARSGNVTAALWYADDIQNLSSQLNQTSYSSNPSVILNADNFTNISPPAPSESCIGMTGEDWKLITVAASKSAHWKVCVGSLQFLQPFVEATHPKYASVRSTVSRKALDRQYEKLARALTAAILSLEMRSQYAWAIRTMNDWIEWSGRRPRKEAVFSLCNILAARGRGDHVVGLIQQILQIPASTLDPSLKKSGAVAFDYNTSYEWAIYTNAITALVRNGFYDNADELYAAAVSGGFLPYALSTQSSVPFDSPLILDLHGMNIALAHAAVRVSLQHLIQSRGGQPIVDDIVIITGRGKGSTQRLRPVLRPEVQRMLMEEFYPPLSTTSLPGNMGALSVSASDVNEWMKHQQQQRGARLLTVAEILKSFTSGSRLIKALFRIQN